MSRAALRTIIPGLETPPPTQTVCVVSVGIVPQIITNTGTTCGMNIMLPDTENAPPSEMVERVTKAIMFEDCGSTEGWEDNTALGKAALKAMLEPTAPMWNGLGRDLIMWMDFKQPTPQSLFTHLENCRGTVPQWLRVEPEMTYLNHVPSKGTRAVLVFKAMIKTALEGRGAKS